MSLGDQFKEHMELRKAVGLEIAENRRLNPIPDEVKKEHPNSVASHGRPGDMHKSPTIEGKNQWLREKLASTKISNAIARGETEPTDKRFG